MNTNPLSGTGKVFKFSLKQTISAKGWLVSTILIAALLLIGIPLILWAASSAANKDEEDDPNKATLKTVYVVDETEGAVDYNILKEGQEGEYGALTYTAFDSTDAAIAEADKKEGTIILHITKPDNRYLVTVVLPDESDLSRSNASSFAGFVESQFSNILVAKAELTPEGVMLLKMPVSAEAMSLSKDSGEESEEKSLTEELLGFLVPFLTIMLLYMMVLLYGQSVANSVMLEKNSKLIESILTAVNPVALMTGKLFAGAFAAILQLMIWLGCLLGGIFGGAMFAMRMVPDNTNSTVNTVNMIMESDMNISIVGLILGLLVIALGFVLYLSLSCLSGSLASKQEDLNKTNVVFVLVLVASFFICIGGGMANMGEQSNGSISMISDAGWMRIFPFTAILVAPSDMLMGKMSAGMIAGCFAALIVSVALFVVIAARVYKLLVFYRGNPPTPKALLAMLKDAKNEKKA